MKCVILLSLVALCYSLPATYGTGKNINISEDGTITITTPDGKQVVISKAIGVTDRFIDVSVQGPNVIPKRIQIDSQAAGKSVSVAAGDNQYAAQYDYYADLKEREKRSPKVPAKEAVNKTQGAILTEIFTDYQGIVDDKSYVKLLAKVSDYVESGQVDPSIYDVLAYLNDQRQQEQQAAADASVNPVKTWRQTMWQSWILNYLRSRAQQQNPELSGNTWGQQQPWGQQQLPWGQQQPWAQQQPWGQQQPSVQPQQPWVQPQQQQPWAQQQPWGQQQQQPWAGQPWNAQPSFSQWPVQQANQPTGKTSVPLQRVQGPSILNTQFLQPSSLQQQQQPGQVPVQQTQQNVPVRQPAGQPVQFYAPVYQPYPAGYQPGFPWMQFYWNRIASQQKQDTTTDPSVDARV